MLKQILEVELGIDFVFSESEELTEGEISSPGINEKTVSPPSRKTEPIIKSAMDVFNGKVIKEDYVKEGGK